LTSLSGQACTFTFAPGAIDLATDTTHGPIGIYAPGVYCTSGATSIGTAGITLSGSGTYIFRVSGALTTVANSVVTLTGASACDVFWTPTSATTLGANSTFRGTNIDASGITIGSTVAWIGRALAFGGTVTTDTDTLTTPTCTTPVVTTTTTTTTTSTPPASTPALVPPLISLTKVPSLLALLSTGGGSVAFDYTVKNVGTVAMSNITLTDNKCATATFLSGDTNGDLKLDTSETWKYRCTANVTQTTTNTAVVTGQANGFTATDTAQATVVVGAALPPPLIHLEKIPSVFVLPVSGGAVTYRYTVTNPGTVALTNVSVVDNKCSSFSGRSGDVNNNNLLDVNEVWTYTCQANLTQTTTNTGTAQGSANGLTATDYSLATVVVTAPTLPRTGFPPQEKNAPWNIIIPVGIFVALFSFYLARKKQTN